MDDVLLTCGSWLEVDIFHWLYLMILVIWSILGICMMLVLYWVFFLLEYLIFLITKCYLWGSFCYKDSLPRIILWFDYLCVDCILFLLHYGSGSLIRWPHDWEVVYSYHLGPPETDRCWMLLDTVVPLSFFLLSWRLLLIWCISNV